MRKLFTLFAFVLTLVVLAGCNDQSNVKITLKNVAAARTTIYMELDVTDPDKEIPADGIVIVLYKNGEEVSRKAPTITTELTSVMFDGLAVNTKYSYSVFATYGGKSHKMATGESTTTTSGSSVDEPKLITTIEEFLNIPNDLTAYYRLENDLDFLEAKFQNQFGSKQFAGTFDGNGKTIKNLTMDTTTTFIGLFGYNRGTIKNLTIENVITDFKTSTQNIGIVAGKSSGTIENVTIKNSTVKAAYSRTGQIYIGAVVGLAETGSKLTNIQIENSHLELTISGRTEPFAGLLVGRAQATKIDNSSAQGTISVTALDTINVGGLVGGIENVGLSSSSITESSADVNILADVNVTNTTTNDKAQLVFIGGLVGSSVGTNISSVYALGDIELSRASNTSANDRSDDEIGVGGLVGITSSPIVNAFAKGSILIGNAEVVSIISFEKMSVGGLAGIQLGGERLDKSVYMGASIQVYPGAKGQVQLSSTVGNMVTTKAVDLAGGTVKLINDLIAGRVVVTYGEEIVTTPSDTTTIESAALVTFFDSDFIKDALAE
ncbi:hypothetical protein N7603_01395 [Acholeplasma vituli]|uniref:GLUG domain-containing protein n=1 Tax=Paracholeplasma vituli TaxID=69473 RepID=A0ABT2PTN0_9MOLU|nr:hypothetical protein [Paracholeplasma vituli]MCU0104306.1 hypothetical protein [Paracholeplasma vituli]